MLAVLLMVLLPLVLSHWLLQPLAAILTPLLDLSWLGWLVGGGVLWLLAGGD